MKSLAPQRNCLTTYQPNRGALPSACLVLNQTHAMPETQLHAWCREKGLFEHQLKAWGEAFCSATAPESREARTALRELAKSNTMRCSVNCVEKRRRWPKPRPCWCCKKSSRPCGRTRRNEHLQTASDPADADPAVLRQWRTSAKGLRADWVGCAYCSALETPEKPAGRPQGRGQTPHHRAAQQAQ